MSEYILGLGISVQICKKYEELISFALADSEDCYAFHECVIDLQSLVDDENEAYNKLNKDTVLMYYDRISDKDFVELDVVKSRYCSKLRERLNILDGSNYSGYPFSLNTAIAGKILLDSMKKVEKDILINLNKSDGNSIHDLLYSFHRTYKYTLISMNEFLERLALDFNFNISEMPNISFERIKENFDCNDKFDDYLDSVLLMVAKDIIKILSSNCDNIDITSIYSNLLSISQLEVVAAYLSKGTLEELRDYSLSCDAYSSKNGKYLKKMIDNKICGDVNV